MPSLKISEHTDRPELIDFLKSHLGVQLHSLDFIGSLLIKVFL